MPVQIKRRGLPDKIPIDMTPMIDIVFQLLAFFCMTLRVADVEGDFNIKMPRFVPAASEQDFNRAQRMILTLRADAAGNLVAMSLGQRDFDLSAEPWTQLRQYVASRLGPGDLGESPEVELACSYNLRYDYVIRAVTSVSGDVGPDGQIIRLVEKISFAPPLPGAP
jgi:biopolymer transport protein ExbD